MSWILYLPIVFLVFGLGTAVALRQVMARSARPLRFQYRLQWITCALVAIPALVFIWQAVVNRPFARVKLLGPACLAITVAATAYNLRRLRPKVLAEQPRPAAPPFKAPPLLWPLAVVLLPIVILAVMAAWTLASDRLSARAEAKARAAEIAAGVLATAEADFQIVEFEPGGYTVTKGQDFVSLNAQYQLILARPWVWPPQPAPLTAKNFGNLTTNKLAQWRAAEKAFDANEWSQAAELYLKFLDGRRRQSTGPMADFHAGIADSRFRPIALSRRAQALERLGDVPGAIAAYNDIFDGFTFGPECIAESGLSLAPIAVLKILDLARDNPAALPEDWRRNPSFVISELSQNGPISPLSVEAIRRLRLIAPSLMDASGSQQRPESLFDLWDRFERTRRFYTAASVQLGTNAWPDIFWVKGFEDWLAVKQSPPASSPKSQGREKPHDDIFYAAISGKWFWRQLIDRCAELDRHRDFVVVAEVAGEKLSLSTSPVEKNRFEAADAQQVHSALQPISLSVGLADPETYFKAVRRRQVLFVSLIVGALLAGVAAAITLRRTLLRQQALNDQKSNFVSSVSHELRAPIASVRLMAESLERGKVAGGEKQNEYFRFIVQECRRLSSLIENVLDFSRIEQGRKQYEFEPTNLLALTRETVKLMEPYAEEKGVKLIFETLNLELGTSNVEQDVDGRAIQQALVNLIDNAIKHSARGQTVAVGLVAEEKMPVLLYVEDHGPGIPLAEQEKIFERFYRLGSELRRETQGVGIGLSIVRHIVAAHGGKVTVRSNPGAGSRFTIVLPNKKPLTTDEHR